MPGPRTRNTAMVAIGAVVVAVAVVASVVLWLASAQRVRDNVAGFARAPMGCDTTLNFERPGSFVLYVETSGEFDRLQGACDAPAVYDRDASTDLRPDLALTGPDGDERRLESTTDVSYDTDGFTGRAYRGVEIASVGEHVLTVQPETGGSFVIAVGRDPHEGTALFRLLSVGVAVAGLLAGGLLIVLGSRRRPLPAATPVPWTPVGGPWPSSPPGHPVPPPTTGAERPAGVSPPPWGPPGTGGNRT